MSQPAKPSTPAKAKPKAEQAAGKTLPEGELEKVSGGVTLSDIPITKTYDKSSPKIG